MISDHYDKTASVERQAITIGYKKEFEAHLASVSCLIQPLSDEVSEDMTGSFGKDFLMLSAVVDIQEGDRVIIDLEEYRVMGTEALEFGGNPHRESRIRIFKYSEMDMQIKIQNLEKLKTGFQKAHAIATREFGMAIEKRA